MSFLDVPGVKNGAALDAAVTAKINDGASATATALNATILENIEATVPAPSGTISGLSAAGNSTWRGTDYGDSERGILGNTIQVNGMSWLSCAARASNGRLVRGVNASVIGNTMAQIVARLQADVIDHPARNGTSVLLGEGYNSAFENVSVAAYMASFAEGHQLLKAAQIETLAATPLPTNNNEAIRVRLAEYAAAKRVYAAQHGLFMVDLHALTEHTDGGLIPSVKTDGDGVHPGADGQRVLGEMVLDALKNRLPRFAVNPANDWGTLGNLTPDRTFEGAVTDGIPADVYIHGAAIAGAVPSVVDGGEFIAGNWFKVTHTATVSPQIYRQRVTPAAGRVDPGDVIAITGLTAVTGGIELSVGPEWNTFPFNEKAINTIKSNYARSDYYAEFTAPGDFSAPYLDILMTSGPGTGTAAFAQLGVYNLTKSHRVA